MNDNGDVAFVAGTMQRDGPVSSAAVYASSHQTLRLVARNGGFVPGLGAVIGFGDPLTAFINARGTVILQVGSLDSEFNFHTKLLEAGPLAK